MWTVEIFELSLDVAHPIVAIRITCSRTTGDWTENSMAVLFV
jgi:hypothetical protein